MITGYNDVFNRTVSGGFGTATSGQAYTVTSTASQYNVTPGTATILPTATGERAAYVDRQTSDIDITGQVALSAIPASNLMTVGFIVKRDATGNNYYTGVMSVATGGAISLRFSKVVGGGLTTVTTVATGLTYVANTFYNLRVAVFWSDALQAMVLRSKLWVVGGTEPGGWMVNLTDSSLTQYTAGTNAGLFTRDEQAAPGTITAKIQNVATKAIGLAIPAGTDPVCYDPSVAYPKQTVIQAMAAGADAAMTLLDPRADLAGLFPRVRVSNSNIVFTATTGIYAVPYTATEFNVGTPTNLGYDADSITFGAGIWLITFEIELSGAAVLSDMQVQVTGNTLIVAGPTIQMRTNVTNVSDNGEGGSAHLSYLAYQTNPAATGSVNATLLVTSTSVAYTIKYAALSAIKISDYFA